MKQKAKQVLNSIRNINFKSKSIIAIVVCIFVVLISGIIFMSYSYYENKSSNLVVGGYAIVGDSDIELKVYRENRDVYGVGLGTYSEVFYVPKVNYEYDATQTVCSDGLTITNYVNFKFTVNATNRGFCKVYFNSIDGFVEDAEVNIYLERVADSGNYEPVGIIPDDKIYEINNSLTSCSNNATVALVDGEIELATSSNAVCNVYLDYTGTRNLTNAILADNGGTNTILAKETPDFSTISPTDGNTEKATYEIASRGMYAAEDDFGTSYYYRGNVDNNWVKFDGPTSDIYFRIIRINGDGTVRIIYTGTTAPTEEQKVTMTGYGTTIGVKAFSEFSNNAEYVGYRYALGNAHGTEFASTVQGINLQQVEYENTIDRWYGENILINSKYVNVISNEQILCNDRTGYLDSNCTIPGGGTGTTATFYGSFKRFCLERSTPTLVCTNPLDMFTVASASIGNNALQYPVGLITADEVAMAGGYFVQGNYGYYLYINTPGFWTASPAFYADNNIAGFGVYADGTLNHGFYNGLLGIRPVISLKSDLAITGTGTWNDPYVVDGL